MTNLEIRKEIKKNRLFHYEIADVLGISESTLSKWLRKEMDIGRKELIIQAIRKLQNAV